jgi:hypothetical protein
MARVNGGSYLTYAATWCGCAFKAAFCCQWTPAPYTYTCN